MKVKSDNKPEFITTFTSLQKVGILQTVKTYFNEVEKIEDFEVHVVKSKEIRDTDLFCLYSSYLEGRKSFTLGKDLYIGDSNLSFLIIRLNKRYVKPDYKFTDETAQILGYNSPKHLHIILENIIDPFENTKIELPEKVNYYVKNKRCYIQPFVKIEEEFGSIPIGVNKTKIGLLKSKVFYFPFYLLQILERDVEIIFTSANQVYKLTKEQLTLIGDLVDGDKYKVNKLLSVKEGFLAKFKI